VRTERWALESTCPAALSDLVRQIVYVPSPHNGRHVTRLHHAATLRLFFDGPSNYAVVMRTSPVGRAELLARLGALADDTRLRILELFDREGKLAMPWDAVRLGKDTRIGPKKTRVEQFNFKLTNSKDVRVEARVLERLVSEQAAQYAGVPAAPAMLMAEAAAAVP